jgi:hypothetical protein
MDSTNQMEVSSLQDELDDWRAVPTTAKTSKLIQMEIDCTKLTLEKPPPDNHKSGQPEEEQNSSLQEGNKPQPQEQYKKKTGKIGKAEARKLAAGNSSMMDWLAASPRPNEKSQEESRKMIWKE